MIGIEKYVYRFAGFELEPSERRLTTDGKAIALTPKVFDTLVFLVENAGRAISKDELMKALWPRGYVEEATLSNQIWQIRRALGDTAKGTRFIETLPKLGYRFVAPVVRELAPATAAIVTLTKNLPPPTETAPVATPPAMPAAAAREPQRMRVSWAVLIATTAVLLAAVITAWSTMHHRNLDGALSGGHTVALVGFNNLSQNAKDAWLTPALIEMLGSELGAAADIRVIPDELVREASRDMAAPLTGGYGRGTLSLLRRRLGADYVISGSYLVAAGAEDPTLRVDVQLQDANSGALVGTLSKQGTLSSLPQLANQTGASLRDKLGVSIPTAEAASLMMNVEPPTTDVARRIGVATDAMERHDVVRARDELIEVVAEAPQFAPAYLYLSRAWSAMGFREKALAAAQQASARLSNLPPDIKLEIAAAVQTESYEWPSAVASWKSLVALKPSALEYRIHEIEAEVSLGDFVSAHAAFVDLQHLPEALGDPRVALIASRLALAQNDVAAAERLAGQALAESESRRLPGLAAEAALSRASARTLLGKYDLATADARSAIAYFGSSGNPHGESAARRQLAAIIADQDHVADAHQEYSRALAIAQRVGDDGEVGAIYRNLSSLLWIEGDRDGARAAARQALAVARETGDLPLQAWTLRALASIEADDAATDEVMAQYREVTELNERAHDRGGHVWSLANLADVLRLRGELDQAREACDRAMTEAVALTDPQFTVFSTFTCAEVALDRGETDRSRALFAKVASLSAAGHNPIYAANTELKLGQIESEAAHWTEAARRLRLAAQGFAGIDAATGEADADALLAICAETTGDTAERDRALARTRKLRAAITTRQEVYFVDIALAQVDGAAHGDAAARLHALALDAEHRGFVSWSFEAKLAQWRVLAAHGSPEARSLRAQLERDARSRGFNRIVALLELPPHSIRDTWSDAM
jgi:DNA-binding winged helix-turn-helix (wHTH) protein/tetratricopeptide (TPR) repeat protein